MKIIAIGDVHGSIHHLRKLVEKVIDTKAELIFLGDLIDRSQTPDGDLEVIKLVRYMQEHPERYGIDKVTVLKGNHEEFLISILNEPTPDLIELWEHNGGRPELLDQFAEHKEWLENLPVYQVRDNYLFVHAGVMPGVPLEEQSEADMLWIRKPFLETADHSLPYHIVHGHSVVDITDKHPQNNRTNLDYGCCFGGPLKYMTINLQEDDESRTSKAVHSIDEISIG